MLNRKSLSLLLPGLAALFLIQACSSDKGNGPSDNFDRQAMLRNYADNLIKPAYADLLGNTESLRASVAAFNASPSSLELGALQTAWAAAYSSWLYANAYNFGPAGEEGLRKGLIEEIGTFPVSKTKIENAILSGQWNLQDFNRDARGFLAMEYLIFGENQSAAEVAGAYVTDANRRNYLTALAEDLVDRVTEVSDAWNGAYYNAFIQNDGTDVGSSTSALYNEFVRSYEAIKNLKMGLPLGKRPGQTQTEPELVEAYYSGASIPSLKIHFSAIENIWYGRAKNGQDGIGFREYLESVEGGTALIASTETQLAAVKTALAAVPNQPSMPEQITGDKTALENLYTELQKMTRFFKSDMSSLLGIAITFSSSDGD